MAALRELSKSVRHTEPIEAENEDRDSLLSDLTEQQNQGRESRGPHKEASRRCSRDYRRQGRSV